MPLDSEGGEERCDLRGPHLSGMALAVEENVAPNPADVGLLGAPAAVEGLKRLLDAVEEPGRGRAGRAYGAKDRGRAGVQLRRSPTEPSSRGNLCQGHVHVPLFGSRGPYDSAPRLDPARR